MPRPEPTEPPGEGQAPPNELGLEDKKIAQVEERSAISPVIVHEAIRSEGEEELGRPSSALG